MKTVTEWAAQHGMTITEDPNVVVIGLNPALKGSSGITSTFQRLITWFRMVRHPDFTFTNIHPSPKFDGKMSSLNWNWIEANIEPHRGKKIVALGSFVSKVLNKMEIDHLAINHPSARNLYWNDWNNEVETVKQIREYLFDA